MTTDIITHIPSYRRAWTGLAHGRKRWFFYAPGQSPPAGGSGQNMYPTFTITDWVDQVLPLLPSSQRPLEVIQEPGDLMYRRLC